MINVFRCHKINSYLFFYIDTRIGMSEQKLLLADAKFDCGHRSLEF